MTERKQIDPIEGKNSIIYIDDALERLRELPDESVQVCITSPPYYGMRDNQTATWEKGDPNCDHRPPPAISQLRNDTLQHGRRRADVHVMDNAGYECSKCGAVRAVDYQIGLEPGTPQYIERLSDVFREVYRVLKDDGVFWCVIGDVYSNNHHKGERPELPPKNLYGIPFKFATRLLKEDHKWFFRSDIIWHMYPANPNPAKDRCTSAHDHIFQFTKRKSYKYYQMVTAAKDMRDNAVANMRDVWYVQKDMSPSDYDFTVLPEAIVNPLILASSDESDTILDPFAGSSAVGKAALSLGRKYIGIELNENYARMGAAKLSKRSMSLAPFALTLNDAGKRRVLVYRQKDKMDEIEKLRLREALLIKKNRRLEKRVEKLEETTRDERRYANECGLQSGD